MIELTDVELVIPPIRKGDEARTLLTGISLTLSERRVAVIGANYEIGRASCRERV